MRLKCLKIQLRKMCFPFQCLPHSLREASITSLCEGESVESAGEGEAERAGTHQIHLALPHAFKSILIDFKEVNQGKSIKETP